MTDTTIERAEVLDVVHTPVISGIWSKDNEDQFRAHLFGSLVQLALDTSLTTPITRYFSDTYRDAQWLMENVDGWVMEFDYCIGDCGTHIGEALGAESNTDQFPTRYRVNIDLEQPLQLPHHVYRIVRIR